MLSEILTPEYKLTRSDAAMIARRSDPEYGGKEWMEQLEAKHRQAIVGKIVASINELSVKDRNDQKILARLALVLARFDAIDLDREQGALRSVTNNTQINVGGPAEMFREVIAEIRAAEHPEAPAAEPARDD